MQRTLERELKVPETVVGEAVDWADRVPRSPGGSGCGVPGTVSFRRPGLKRLVEIRVLLGSDQWGLAWRERVFRGTQGNLPIPGHSHPWVGWESIGGPLGEGRPSFWCVGLVTACSGRLGCRREGNTSPPRSLEAKPTVPS